MIMLSNQKIRLLLALLCVLIGIGICIHLFLESGDFFSFCTNEYYIARCLRIAAILVAVTLGAGFLLAPSVEKTANSRYAMHLGVAFFALAIVFAITQCFGFGFSHRCLLGFHPAVSSAAAWLLLRDSRTADTRRGAVGVLLYIGFSMASIAALLGFRLLLGRSINPVDAGWMITVSIICAWNVLSRTESGRSGKPDFIACACIAVLFALMPFAVQDDYVRFLLSPERILGWIGVREEAVSSFASGTATALANGDLVLSRGHYLKGIAYNSPLLWLRFEHPVAAVIVFALLLASTAMVWRSSRGVGYLAKGDNIRFCLFRSLAASYVFLMAYGTISLVFGFSYPETGLLAHFGLTALPMLISMILIAVRVGAAFRHAEPATFLKASTMTAANESVPMDPSGAKHEFSPESICPGKHAGDRPEKTVS